MLWLTDLVLLAGGEQRGLGQGQLRARGDQRATAVAGFRGPIRGVGLHGGLAVLESRALAAVRTSASIIERGLRASTDDGGLVSRGSTGMVRDMVFCQRGDGSRVG